MPSFDVAAIAALVGTVYFLRLSLGREKDNEYTSVLVVTSLCLMIGGFYFMFSPLPAESDTREPYTLHLHPEREETEESPSPPREEHYLEATVGHQYTGGYGSQSPKNAAGVGASSASPTAVRGAPTTAGPSCAMKHEPVGFGGDGVPSTSCGIKRGGKPFYMFGVGM